MHYKSRANDDEIMCCYEGINFIQPEGYNMYNCVTQIMEQDYTATRGRPEFCILTLFQYK